MTKLPLKRLILIFGLLALALKLFYFQLDRLFGVKILDVVLIILLVSSLTLLILTIIKATRRDFKPFLIFIFIISTLYFVSFEYLIGWTQFKFNDSERNGLVSNLKNGIYDSVLDKQEYPQYGAWIESHNPRFKIYKDSTLQMLFRWQGHIRTQEEYCGQLYLSDVKQIDNIRVGEFLGREYRKKYLGNNWYWVDCFVDRTPGP